MKDIYNKLSAIGFLAKNYSLKFLFIAFLGVHVPLIVIILFIVFGWISFSPASIIIITLVATLVATGITLYLLKGLLTPLHMAKEALHDFLYFNTIPNLPTWYEDELGILIREIQLTIEKLDDLNQERQDLASLLSHDMRTPFAQYIALAGFIKNEQDLTKIQEYAGLIESSAAKQIETLQHVLEEMKTEHHVYLATPKNEIISIHFLLKEALQNYAITAAEKNIHCTINAIQNYQVKGNFTLLKEAFGNLISNAIKFSFPNATIEISAVLKNAGITITIQDHGLGFTEYQKARLFDRFSNLGTKGTRNETSTGLGLYLTKSIIEKHGGTITAFSEGNNKGACFEVSLPKL